MAQNQSAGDSAEPEETGGSVSDSPEAWGNNGLVGEGRYRLTRRLGRGGMAEVFAAEDVRLGRVVAVKLLRSDLAEDPVSKARFTREAQSVAGLNHHAVVAVYDSGEDLVDGNTVPYIVMELVEGHTIRELLFGSRTPPVDQSLVIVSGVLEALAYSHQHGIVHRDIKPGNVIITGNGAVKVMDFGIARALHGAQSTMTQTGMVMGTPQYLSPEQALGKTVDARSDLYAVGCLLYELLVRRPPFTGETPLSVVYQHVQDEAQPPSQAESSVPPELDGLVMRSLAKDPDDRFQSAEEMRGLVQYALRMLHEQGGHTGGLWNTGPATSGGRASSGTPAMGTPVVSGAAAGRGTGDTPPIGPPLLMGRPGGDDSGGFEGGHGGGAAGRSRKGLQYALVAFVAVLAVLGGVFFALENRGDPGDNNKAPGSETSTSPSEQEQEPEKRTPSETPEETEPGSGGRHDDWTQPRETPSNPATEPETPSSSPTHEPTDPGTGTDTGTGETGSTTGTDEGTTDGSGATGDTTGTDTAGTTDGTSSGSDTSVGQGDPGGSDTGTDSTGVTGA